MKKIMLDPGHGGRDPGAVDGYDDDLLYTEEKDLAYNIAIRVERLLKFKSDYKIYKTREHNQFVSLNERAELANVNEVDVFISIHLNAYGCVSASGYEVYCYPTSKKGRVLRNIILNKLNNKIVEIESRGGKTAEFYVLKYTKMPAILIEAGFITNPDNEKLLYNLDIRHRIAKAIVEGIDIYFNIT